MQIFNTNKSLFSDLRTHADEYNIEIDDSAVYIYNGINTTKRFNKNDFIIMLFKEAELSVKNVNFV